MRHHDRASFASHQGAGPVASIGSIVDRHALAAAGQREDLAIRGRRGVFTEHPGTPRTRYALALVAAEDLPPEPAVIVRPRESTAISLPHRSLGDRYAQLLADVVNELPQVTLETRA